MSTLTDLTNRQQMILLLLVSSNQPQTSLTIAKKLGVSSRTVKTEMAVIATVLKNNGAQLIAKRNNGYSLVVDDKIAFGSMKEYLRSKTAHINLANSRESVLFVYLTRQLIASDTFTSIETMCTRLYISPSTLHNLLNDVYPFFKSFHLNVVTNSKGVKVSGEEQYLRLAMTELVELHPVTQNRVNQDENYERWVECPFQQRQDIRHLFLKVLRESGFAVRDSVSHRLAMYLIIARNRRLAGYRINQLPTETAVIKQSQIYILATDIIQTLNQRFSGYDFEENEVSFLASLLMANLDLTLCNDLYAVAPYLNKKLKDTVLAVNQRLNQVLQPQAGDINWDETLIAQLILPLLLGKQLALDGYNHYDFSSDQTYQKNPVCMFLAAVTCQIIRQQTGCNISLSDECTLACGYLSQLVQTTYPIKKLRILTTHSIAGRFAKIQATGLEKYFSFLIEDITPVELYEIRGLPEEYYDVVLTENVKPGEKNQGLFGYNYEYPAATIQMLDNGRDFSTIYNEVLTLAYQTAQFIPSDNLIHFYDDFEYFSRNQVCQLFAERYAKDKTLTEKLYRFLTEENSRNCVSRNETVFLFGSIRYCQKGYLDMYTLAKPGRFDGVKVKYVFFVCLPENLSMPALKVWDSILATLDVQPGLPAAFRTEPQKTMQEIIHCSLTIE